MNSPFHASGDLRQLKARAGLYWPEQYVAFDGTPPAGAERLLALTPGRWHLRRSRVALDFGTATSSLFLPGQGA